MDIPSTTWEPSVFRAAELAPMTPGGTGPPTSPAFPPKAKFRGGNSNSAAKNNQAPHLQAPGTPCAGMIRAPSHRFPASSTIHTAGTYGSGRSGWSGGGGGAQPAESMKRKRPRFAEEQLAHLEAHFAVEQELTPASKKQLAARLGVKPRQVCVWFQNRKVRQRTRERETELEGMQAAYAKLQATCRELQDDYELLKSDYQELLLQNTQLFDMMQEIEQQLGNPQIPPGDRPVTSRFNDTTAPDNQPGGSAQSDRGGQSNQSEEEVEIPSVRLQPLHQQQKQRRQVRREERQHLAAAAAAAEAAGEAEEEEEDEEDEDEEEGEAQPGPCATAFNKQAEPLLGNTATCFPIQEFYPAAAGEVSSFTPGPPSGSPFHIHAKNQANPVKPPSYQSNSPDSSLDEIGGAPFALPPPAFPMGVAPTSAPPVLFEPLTAFANPGNRVGESEHFVAPSNQQQGPDLYDLYSQAPASGGGGGAEFLDGWMDGDATAMQQSAGLPFGLTAKAPAEAEAEDGESDSEAARRTTVHGGRNAAFASPSGELVENGLPLDVFSSWNEGLPQACMEGAGEAEQRCAGGEFAGAREDTSGSMRGNQEPFDLLGSMEGAMGGMGCAEDGDASGGVAAADDMASMCGFDMQAYATF
ncbi:unnamed protein product [Closterium sp. Naga37s-1]|nr:unnamed protein product [Closterium sp. Naga37s-1]